MATAAPPNLFSFGPPAGVTAERLNSPRKNGNGNIFYARPHPAERPGCRLEESWAQSVRSARPAVAPPKWGFHIQRNAPREQHAVTPTSAKFEATSAMQAFGVVGSDIDANFRRGDGSLSPRRRQGQTPKEIAGSHSPRSQRRDGYRAAAALGGEVCIDNTFKRGGGSCSPRRRGHMEEVQSRPESKQQRRKECSRLQASDIATVPRRATGSSSPRRQAEQRSPSVGGIASPSRAKDGPDRNHNLMVAESSPRASLFRDCRGPDLEAQRQAGKMPPRINAWSTRRLAEVEKLGKEICVESARLGIAKLQPAANQRNSLRKSASQKRLAGEVLAEMRAKPVRGSSAKAPPGGSGKQPQSPMPSARSPRRLSEPGPEPTPVNTPAGQRRSTLSTGTGPEPCSEPTPISSPSRPSTPLARAPSSTPPPRYRSYSMDTDLCSEPAGEPASSAGSCIEVCQAYPAPVCQAYPAPKPGPTNHSRDHQIAFEELAKTLKALQQARSDAHGLLCAEEESSKLISSVPLSARVSAPAKLLSAADGEVLLRPWAALEKVLCAQEQILEDELNKLERKQGDPRLIGTYW